MPHPPDPTLTTALALAQLARQKAQKRRRASKRTPAASDPPRLSPAQRRGLDYEDEALVLLQDKGLRLLARNQRTPAGEIDLIMRDGAVLVLIEVRSRANTRYGGAAASIDRGKQARLARAASLLLPRLAGLHWGGRTPRIRFDAVVFDDGRPRWIRNAFSPADSFL